ncbi:hypothetical protein FACS1894147_00870 [Spirochaetia bacterium]|nr:hypothetical protein FACS1894147_00870 [Spirochaetia bacterium]
MKKENIEEAKTLLMPDEQKKCSNCKFFISAFDKHVTIVDTDFELIESNKCNILDVKLDLMAQVDKDNLSAISDILNLTDSDMSKYSDINCKLPEMFADGQSACKKWRAK